MLVMRLMGSRCGKTLLFLTLTLVLLSLSRTLSVALSVKVESVVSSFSFEGLGVGGIPPRAGEAGTGGICGLGVCASDTCRAGEGRGGGRDGGTRLLGWDERGLGRARARARSA